MPATVTSLTARRRQEELAWTAASGVAEYLTARLAGDQQAKNRVLTAANELANHGETSLKDEINALRTHKAVA